MMPRVTVCVMTHNCGRFVAGAIESVLNQSLHEIQLIISDDASVDETNVVVQNYLHDHRVRYIRHDRRLGQAVHWGWLLKQGTAEIVCVLHGDDEYLPDCLATAVQTFDDAPELEMAFANFYRFVDLGEHSDELALPGETWEMAGVGAFRRFAKAHHCLPSAMFVKRSLVNRVPPPDPAFTMLCDREYSLRLAIAAKRVARILAATTRYRVHQSGITAITARNGVFADELEQLPRHLHRSLQDHATQFSSIRAELNAALRVIRTDCGRQLSRLGLAEFLDGDRSKGRNTMRRGWRLAPQLAFDFKCLIDRGLMEIWDPFRLLAWCHPGDNRRLIEVLV